MPQNWPIPYLSSSPTLLLTGVFPIASVIPVHKRNSRAHPPKLQTHLLANISKFMESVVNHLLQTYLLNNKLISNRLLGFIPNRINKPYLGFTTLFHFRINEPYMYFISD